MYFDCVTISTDSFSNGYLVTSFSKLINKILAVAKLQNENLKKTNRDKTTLAVKLKDDDKPGTLLKLFK